MHPARKNGPRMPASWLQFSRSSATRRNSKLTPSP